MKIYLTKKLADKIKINPPREDENPDGLYSWRANIVESGSTVLTVFMNEASRYIIVLKNLKNKDYSILPELFTKILRDVMAADQFNPEVIDFYIKEAGKITYIRNAGKQQTAYLNKACDNACLVLYTANDNIGISYTASHWGISMDDIYTLSNPSKKFKALLSVYELPVNKFKAFDLSVKLDLNGGVAERSISVPADITFRQLHKILQRAYKWHDYHLYKFCFSPKDKFDEMESEFDLVTGGEELFENKKAKLIDDVKLSDYLPEYMNILYIYDYGDYWHHYIKINKIIDDCGDELPWLLSGKGDSPPEDVGGKNGYENFIKIINDPNNKNYVNTIKWADNQDWKRYDYENVWRGVHFALDH